MAVELSSMRERKAGGIMTHLSSAACEWLLIFLLFVDALFSYLLQEFAKYCELQTPCPLCSRLDHVFKKTKLECSWSLMCSRHKAEISSLVFCSVHSNLASAHGMCGECIKSIAMQRDSECKLLVGKMWVDVERSFVQELMMDKRISFGGSASRTCSCCKKTWMVATLDDESLLGVKPVELGGYKVNAEPPPTHVPGCRRFSREDGMKRLRNKLRTSMRHRTTGNNNIVGTLSGVGYTELKHSSDSESGSLLPEDDGGDWDSSSISDGHTRHEHDVGLERRMPVNDVTSEKQTEQGSEMKDQPGLIDLNELRSSAASMVEDASREHRWAESNREPNPCLMEDAISLDRVESSSFSEVSHNVPSASTTLRITKKSIYIEESCAQVNISAAKNVEAMAGSSSDESTHSSNSHIKNLTGSLSRISTSESGLLLLDAGPRPHDEHEESRKDEDCCSPSLPLPLSLKRNDSSIESLDGVSVSDIELDQRCMKVLYEELEEERNAAGIAASHAMAMITRLQEEKAAVEMEAVQCIQMMELQAEHDMESLERANDLLSEKEKELQDLQRELEFYRNNFFDAATRSENSPDTSSGSESARFSKENGQCEPMTSSVSNFGDEKLCISHSLKKLVKNLYKDYCSDNVQDSPNGLDLYKIEDFLPNADTLLNFEQNGSSVSKGNPAQFFESNDSCGDAEENCFHNEKNDSVPRSAAFLKEISKLDDRLEEDGLQLIVGIAHQLQKL